MTTDTNLILHPVLEQNPEVLGTTGLLFQNVATVVLMIVLVLVAVLCTLYRKELKQLLQVLFVPHIVFQILRETSMVRQRILSLLLPIVVLMQSLLLYVLCSLIVPTVSERVSVMSLLGLCLGCILLDFLFKILNINIFTRIFNYLKTERQICELQKLSYLTLNSLFLLPVLAAYLYTGYLFLLVLYAFFFAGTYLTMSYRFFQINFQKQNTFQFFLYFCTVEILPYLVLLKAVLSFDT